MKENEDYGLLRFKPDDDYAIEPGFLWMGLLTSRKGWVEPTHPWYSRIRVPIPTGDNMKFSTAYNLPVGPCKLMVESAALWATKAEETPLWAHDENMCLDVLVTSELELRFHMEVRDLWEYSEFVSFRKILELKGLL